MTDKEQFYLDSLAFIQRVMPDISLKNQEWAAREIVDNFMGLFNASGARISKAVQETREAIALTNARIAQSEQDLAREGRGK